jgi:hypothetical protein
MRVDGQSTYTLLWLACVQEQIHRLGIRRTRECRGGGREVPGQVPVRGSVTRSRNSKRRARRRRQTKVLGMGRGGSGSLAHKCHCRRKVGK